MPAMEDVAESLVPVDSAAVVSATAAAEVVEETTTVERVVAGGGAGHSAIAAAVVAAAASSVVAVPASAGGAVALVVSGVPTFPARSLVVKFEKPAPAKTSATLRPVASNGVTSDCAESLFAMSEPPTAGSIRGTMPLKTAVVGRVGSLHKVGMFWTKGLKFCSAAMKSWAALTASAPVPS